VKRWITGLLLVLLACVPVLLSRHAEPALLKDSDTAYLLEQIRERQDPLSWFTGDWPLQNHFYRPIATLTIEADNSLYGTYAAGNGWTNALLAVLCIVALFWFLREVTDQPVVATAATLLFASWHLPGGWLATLCIWITYAVTLLGLLRNPTRPLVWASAGLIWLFVTLDVKPLALLDFGVIGWLPGRTATVMTLFVLLCLASYSRYERLSAVLEPRTVSPLDPPATKGTRFRVVAGASSAWWAGLSIVCLLLALGSYEQAVMVPALLVGCAVSFRLRGYRVRWTWQIAYWAALVLYLVVRRMLVPVDTSGYQLQALRSGPGIVLDLAAYALPAAALLPGFLASLVGWPVIFFSTFWLSVSIMGANVVAIFEARRQLVLVLTGYALSILAFLPMAWLNRFDHYHYLPLAFRALFVVGMGWVALEVSAIALSPRARQAPLRLVPAPGSLPRP
jgi:hypothetical protein